MAIFKNRSISSTQDIWLVFAACAFPIHVWAIIDVLRELPAWILRMSTSEMLGTMAYSMVYALVDTIVIFLGLLLLGLILPSRWTGNRFVVFAGIFALITELWLITFHLNSNWFNSRQLIPLTLWAFSYLLALAVAYSALQRQPRLKEATLAFIQRIATLSALYLSIDVLSIVFVVVRNI